MGRNRRPPVNLAQLGNRSDFRVLTGSDATPSRSDWPHRLRSSRNSRSSRAILALLVLSFSLYLPGCGSGSGASSPSSYEVNLTWDAPTSSPDPVAGYNVYRAVSGSSTYQLLNSSVDTSTTYTDTTVADNTSYTYYVESVDAEGNESVPSNTFTISIP